MKLPKTKDVAELVRLPAVLSVPGDVFLGAATSGRKPPPGELVRLAAASGCLYLAGMALNDYADKNVDAVERPHRPIPSGRVEPRFALGLACGLTAAGLGLAAAGGRRFLGAAAPLAAAVWAYDLFLKKTPLGPAAMATTRFLDVLMGAGTSDARGSLPAAGVVAGHTFLVTTVSRREAWGGTRRLALGALAGSTAVALAAAKVSLGDRGAGGPNLPVRARWRARKAASAVLLGAHAATMVGAELAALRDPGAENLRRVVGAGVLGLMPLEGGMLFSAGAVWRPLAVAAAWPLARRLARKGSVT